jgi:hypothetical protein
LGLLAARELRPRTADRDGPVTRVIDVLAGELGWDPTRAASESERFADEAAAEGLDGS